MTQNIKLCIWHVLITATALGLWFDVAKWFQALRLEKDFASFAVVTFALLVGLVGLGFLMFSKKWLVLSFSSLIWLAFALNFGASRLSLIGLVILILVNLRSRVDISAELLERTKINSKVILRRGAMPFVLGLFILASFAAYESHAFERFKNLEKLPAESEEYIRVVVENTIGRKLEVGGTEKQLVIDRVSQETTHELNTFLKPYFQYAPPVLAFTLFLLLWGMSWIFVWISVWLGMLIFWILKKSKFIKIEERDVKTEVLVVR